MARVVAVEDVVVLVERRAVADLDGVVDLRPGPAGSARRYSRFVRRQRVAGPQRRHARDRVELAAVVDAAGRLVVVAADDRDRVQRRMRSMTAFGLGAVADQIAEHQRRVPAAGGARSSTASSASMFAWMSERIR